MSRLADMDTNARRNAGAPAGPTRWFTSDLHLGHSNIIRYCQRPFADASTMDRALIENWNATVGTTDEVFVLGDVALGKLSETLAMIGELSGRKILVTGNHDRCWDGHGPRAARHVQRYLDAGFAEVHQGVITLEVAGHSVSACHFPYEGDSQERDRHVSWRPVDEGAWLLHGHVHERWRQRGRMINVGVDVWGFRPVGAAEIAGLIDDGPAERGALVAA